jgi:hypothetical protein
VHHEGSVIYPHETPKSLIFFNDVIWWLPFWWIVLHAWGREPNALRNTLLCPFAAARGNQ